jgi:ABC-type nitrate/sulfonate/bicarbonate transport system permease component
VIVLWRFGAALVLAACWYATSRLIGPESLPGPGTTLTAAADVVSTAAFWTALGETLSSTLAGLVIAAAIAVPLGLFIGANRFATDSSRMSLDFLASIPPVSFLPLALLLFGPTLPMKLMLIGYGACWPLLVRTVAALRDVEPLQHDVCDAFGLGTWVRWTRVYLPATSPGIVVGLRVSLTIALLLSIVAEYIGGAGGLGAELAAMQVAGRADDVLALAAFTALLGVVLNFAMGRLERVAIGWHPSVRLAGAH